VLPRSPLRICTLGDWTKYFSYFLAGTQEGAILNGCLFRPVDIRQSKESILKCLFEFRPHILFCHCIFGNVFRPTDQFEVLSDIRKKFGTKVYYHLGDTRTEPRYPYDISSFVDAVLVNQTENLKKFSQIWKVPTYHWPYGCFYQKEIADGNKEFMHDLVFTGRLNDNGVHGQRTAFIKELRTKIPSFAIYPNDKYPDTKLLTAEIAASAIAILGVCAGYNIKGYMDVRPFQYVGAGGFLLQRYYSEMDKVFNNDEHLVWFNNDNVSDFLHIFEYYKRCKDKIKRIKNKGFEFCQKYHSYKRRVEDVINIAFGVSDRTRVLLNEI
jgi:hypothetical protein